MVVMWGNEWVVMMVGHWVELKVVYWVVDLAGQSDYSWVDQKVALLVAMKVF